MRRRRFLATSGSVIAMLAAGRGIAQTEPSGYPRIINGPMLGVPESDAITVWVRPSGAFEARLEVSETEDFARITASATQMALAESDYCVTLRAGGLQPGRAYFYRVLIDNALDRYTRARAPHRAHTAPAEGTNVSFTLGFGSCARYQIDPVQPIWQQVQQRNPDLFLWLGDNCYGDTTTPGFLREEMRRQRDVLSLQPVLRSIPHLAIWDDHDYALNDSDRTNPVRKEALEIFAQYWANPAYGLDDVPGVFFRYNYGGVDFFFLDGRYYRDPNDEPDVPGKTMLGARQKEWLKQQLSESRAPFKCLVSGGSWTMAKGPASDSWAAFLHERDEIFDFIRDEAIEGVLLMSGDTHVGELNAVPWSRRGGYDFFDLVSSPLAQNTERSWVTRTPEVRIRQPEATSSNFGLITFDLSGPRASATFRLVDIQGQEPWAPMKIYADELRNGVTSWDSKIDATSLARHQRLLENDAYFGSNYPSGFDPQAIFRDSAN